MITHLDFLKEQIKQKDDKKEIYKNKVCHLED
jgi:hypothetical protein